MMLTAQPEIPEAPKTSACFGECSAMMEIEALSVRLEEVELMKCHFKST